MARFSATDSIVRFTLSCTVGLWGLFNHFLNNKKLNNTGFWIIVVANILDLVHSGMMCNIFYNSGIFPLPGTPASWFILLPRENWENPYIADIPDFLNELSSIILDYGIILVAFSTISNYKNVNIIKLVYLIFSLVAIFGCLIIHYIYFGDLLRSSIIPLLLVGSIKFLTLLGIIYVKTKINFIGNSLKSKKSKIKENHALIYFDLLSNVLDHKSRLKWIIIIITMNLVSLSFLLIDIFTGRKLKIFDSAFGIDIFEACLTIAFTSLCYFGYDICI